MDNESNYKLESLNIRAADNGYIIRCEKTLTEKAKAKRRIAMAKKSKNPEVAEAAMPMDHYKSKEQVADSVEEVLKIVKGVLKKNDSNIEFDEAFDEDDG